jgi:hypothetical protein
LSANLDSGNGGLRQQGTATSNPPFPKPRVLDVERAESSHTRPLPSCSGLQLGFDRIHVCRRQQVADDGKDLIPSAVAGAALDGE